MSLLWYYSCLCCLTDIQTDIQVVFRLVVSPYSYCNRWLSSRAGQPPIVPEGRVRMYPLYLGQGRVRMYLGQGRVRMYPVGQGRVRMYPMGQGRVRMYFLRMSDLKRQNVFLYLSRFSWTQVQNTS